MPVIYACSGAWVYSNQQVFMNKVVANTGSTFYPNTDHFISQFFTEITPGTPLFIIIFMLILTRITVFIIEYVKG